MSRVIADITMSVDGFVTAEGADLQHGLGVGGEALHAWAIESDDPVDREVLRTSTAATAAVVMGRRLFDIVDGPQGWDDERGYGADEVGTPPLVVLTHQPPAQVRLQHDLTFVTEGIEAAVARAQEKARRAGAGDVVVMGGAEVVRSALDAGLLDLVRLHVAPETLGAGTPLFEGVGRHRLRQLEVQVSAYAVHLTYAVER